ILFLEIIAYTRKRAAGADSSDERTHFALGLFPDLRSGAAIMRVAIGSVIELVRPEPAALLCKATRDMIVIFWILVWLFRDRLYLRAERTEQMHFLRRLIVRNHNNGAISPRPPDDCNPDPSLTGRSRHHPCPQFKSTPYPRA